MRSDEELREIIAQGGGCFIGVQKGSGSVPDQALFVDAKVGTTLALPVDRITAGAVRSQIRKSRQAFAQGRERMRRAKKRGKCEGGA